jgi:hypothetical protein
MRCLGRAVLSKISSPAPNSMTTRIEINAESETGLYLILFASSAGGS